MHLYGKYHRSIIIVAIRLTWADNKTSFCHQKSTNYVMPPVTFIPRKQRKERIQICDYGATNPEKRQLKILSKLTNMKICFAVQSSVFFSVCLDSVTTIFAL